MKFKYLFSLILLSCIILGAYKAEANSNTRISGNKLSSIFSGLYTGKAEVKSLGFTDNYNFTSIIDSENVVLYMYPANLPSDGNFEPIVLNFTRKEFIRKYGPVVYEQGHGGSILLTFKSRSKNLGILSIKGIGSLQDRTLNTVFTETQSDDNPNACTSGLYLLSIDSDGNFIAKLDPKINQEITSDNELNPDAFQKELILGKLNLDGTFEITQSNIRSGIKTTVTSVVNDDTNVTFKGTYFNKLTKKEDSYEAVFPIGGCEDIE